MAGAMVGGLLGKAVVQKLVDTVTFYLREQFEWEADIKSALEKLEGILNPIQSAFQNAENVELIPGRNTRLETLLWKLRDAVEEAEDVLDEMEYYRLEEQVSSGDAKVRNLAATSRKKSVLSSVTAYRLKSKLLKIGKRVFKRDPTLKKLHAAVGKLEQVNRSLDVLRNVVSLSTLLDSNLSIQTNMNPSRETGSVIAAAEVIGREKDKEWVLKWLTESRGEASISALTIWGVGGVGKTTLAQDVYNDERIEDWFQAKMWVCVSNNHLDMEEIMKKAIHSTKKSPPRSNIMLSLQVKLTEIIRSKKCLLVLDDVWDDQNNQNPFQWEIFLGPLSNHVERGSKILITSRIQLIGDMILRLLPIKKEVFRLDCLHEDESLSLFDKHALANCNRDLYNSKLQSIAKKIVLKCGGLPLALKMIGGLLNAKLDISYWDSVHKKDIINLDQGMDNVVQILKLSYEHLPSNLKKCFRVCSLFPKDYKFRKDELVTLWIGAGCIQQSNGGNELLEDIGRDFIDALVRRSFFVFSEEQLIYAKDDLFQMDNKQYYLEEMFGRSFSIKTEIYTMHDLLHDLARNMSKGECLRVEGMRPDKLPKSLRHLFVDHFYPNLFKEVSSLQKLQTLSLSLKNLDDKSHGEFNRMLMQLKALRALFLKLKFMPSINAISHLIHLRLLHIHLDGDQDFPPLESFLKLYHLQSLKFKGSFSEKINDYSRTELDGMGNLIKLRHLDLPKAIVNKMTQLKYLTEVQELELYSDQLKLSDLKDLNKLHFLSISNYFGKIASFQEDEGANLEKKDHLEMLSLSLSVDNNHLLEEQVYNCLQPQSQSNIKHLKIANYGGARTPRWITNNYLPNVTYIKLCNCKYMKHLPPLGNLPALKGLILEEIPGVWKSGNEFFGTDEISGFPSLEELEISSMVNWVEWTRPENSRWFPRLKKLSIQLCKNLKEVPALPRSLKTMHLNLVGLIAFPAWQEDDMNATAEVSVGLSNAPALEYLNIEYCRELEIVQPFLSNCGLLKSLRLKYCPKVSSSNSFENTLNGLTSLSSLELDSMNRMTILPSASAFSLLTALNRITIVECDSLRSLGGLHALPSLTSLVIWSCRLVETSSDQPQTEFLNPLKDLCIDNPFLLQIEPLRSIRSLENLQVDCVRDYHQYFCYQFLLENRPSLRTLSVGKVSCLSFLPYNMPSLMTLTISKSELESLPDHMPSSLIELVIEQFPSLISLPDHMPPSLMILQILSCRSLLKLPDYMPPSLTKLNIWNCEILESLPDHMPSSLEELYINDCPLLKKLPDDLPSSLMELEISICPLLKSLPNNMPPSLKRLTISDCPELMSLPNKMPSTLSIFQIQKCPLLKKRRGHDWPKIAHISNLYIG